MARREARTRARFAVMPLDDATQRYLSANLFGVSFALGAFFAGTVLRESQFAHRAAQETLPLRDAFAVHFFVAVGMLFDPQVVLDEPLKVLSVVAIIVVGKSVAACASRSRALSWRARRLSA